MKELPIEDNENLVRDQETSAVLNTNNNALQAYKKRREKEMEIEQLKDDVSEIKSLLKQLLNKEG
jgi:hypothetical protein